MHTNTGFVRISQPHCYMVKYWTYYYHLNKCLLKQHTCYVLVYSKWQYNYTWPPVHLCIDFTSFFSKLWSWMAVVSLSLRICQSTKALISAVTLDSLPEPALLLIVPVSWYFRRNLWILLVLAGMPSFLRSFEIFDGLKPFHGNK